MIGFISLFMVLMNRCHGRQTTTAVLQSLPHPYRSNCLLHGMDWNSSFSRKHSHGIPMYTDGRIYLTISLPSTFSELMCGSCVLIRLLEDSQHFYLNQALTEEHRSDPHVSNQVLGIVIDFISISDLCLFNTYMTETPMISHYPIQIEEHPCPVFSKEAQEFLFCTDILCTADSNLRFPTPSLFRDYYNPYYTTLQVRNVQYPIMSIQLYFYSHQRWDLSSNTDLTGFILPSSFMQTHTLDSIVYLDCTDTMNHLYQYQFTLHEWMHLPLSAAYHGGSIMSKFPMNREQINFI